MHKAARLGFSCGSSEVPRLYSTTKMKRKFRPDLTDYLPYVEALRDKLNEEAIYPMSLTDAVKISVERSIEKVLPQVVVNKKRKRYIKLDF